MLYQRVPRLLRALGRVDLLILDDWASSRSTPRPATTSWRSSRTATAATLVTSQFPVYQWHALIGDPTYADAVLDRLVHNAHRFDLNGESLRRTRKPGRKT